MHTRGKQAQRALYVRARTSQSLLLRKPQARPPPLRAFHCALGGLLPSLPRACGAGILGCRRAVAASQACAPPQLSHRKGAPARARERALCLWRTRSPYLREQERPNARDCRVSGAVCAAKASGRQEWHSCGRLRAGGSWAAACAGRPGAARPTRAPALGYTRARRSAAVARADSRRPAGCFCGTDGCVERCRRKRRLRNAPSTAASSA